MNKSHNHSVIKNIAIIGAGSIGTSWAALSVFYGYKVYLWDQDKAAITRAIKLIPTLQNQISNVTGKKSTEGKVFVAISLAEAVEKVDLVHEAVCEDLSVKRSILEKIGEVAKSDAIISSSTSSFPVKTLYRSISSRHRCLVLHPMYPPHLIPLVEVISTESTGARFICSAFEYLEAIGCQPIQVKKELPGFIVNRLQAAILNEAMRLITLGVCTPSEIDKVISVGLAPRWSTMGPLKAATINTVGGFKAFAKNMGDMMFWLNRQHQNIKPWNEGAVNKVIESVEVNSSSNSIEEVRILTNKSLADHMSLMLRGK